MAYSTQRVTSNGTLVLLSLSLEYFDRSEITVYYNGVLNTTGWAWVGTTATQISFTPAVPNAVEITVKRTTDLAALRHVFGLGAAFIVDNLDADLIQVLHIAQEARENATLTEVFNDLNLHGYKIVSVAAGTAAGDAVNYAQLAVHDAVIVGYRDAAAASAVAAAASAVLATTYAVDVAVVAAAEVTTPADANLMAIVVAGVLKKVTWANIKAALYNLTGGINEARGSVAMHATTMNLWAQPNIIDGTGAAVTITAIANAPQAGARRVLYPYVGSTITNGATFAVDGAANYTTEAGDRLEFEAITTSTYKVHITKKNGSAGLANIRVFTTSGTYTAPANLVRAKITVVGGGGNGAAATSTSGGGGGGSGGESIGLFTAAQIGVSQTITVGTATLTSSVGALISASGGTSGSSNSPGTGGVGAGGSVNKKGGAGTPGYNYGGFGYYGGTGGGASGGVGGFNTIGGGGGAFGGGGGGGGPNGSAGGAGGNGVVIIEEYF